MFDALCCLLAFPYIIFLQCNSPHSLIHSLKMADKEATVYIIDVGKSMGRKNYGREQTDLEWSMQYVWDKITTTVSII